MKPFETADHIRKLLKQLDLLTGGCAKRLKLVERLREEAIAVLKPITPEGLDLKNFRHADYLYGHLVNKDDLGVIPYRDALHLLRECTAALEDGEIKERHVELIPRYYAGLDPRLTGGARGRVNRIENARKKKAGDRELANEIWAALDRKPTILGLWRRVALRQKPNLMRDELKMETERLRKRNEEWKPPGS